MKIQKNYVLEISTCSSCPLKTKDYTILNEHYEYCTEYFLTLCLNESYRDGPNILKILNIRNRHLSAGQSTAHTTMPL